MNNENTVVILKGDDFFVSFIFGIFLAPDEICNNNLFDKDYKALWKSIQSYSCCN